MMTVVSLVLLLAAGPVSAAPPEASRCGGVAVDPRVELAAALQSLIPVLGPTDPQQAPEPTRTAMAEVTWGEVLAYRKALREWFAPYQAEPSLKAVADAAPDLGGIRNLERFLLNLGAAPDYAAIGGEVIAGDAKQEALRDAVARFARKSRFDEFFRAQAPLYGRLEAGILKALGPEPCVPAVQGYLGMGTPPEYRILVTPGLLSGPLNAVLQMRDGKTVVVTARGLEDLMPYLETSTRTTHLDLRQELRSTAWHEQAHVVIDSLIRSSSQTVAGLSDRYDAISGLARRVNWEESLSEHFVRAVTDRLIRKEFGPEAAKRSEAGNAQQGYLYAEAARKPLEAYEKDRKRYPRLQDFFPEWLKRFEKETARGR